MAAFGARELDAFMAHWTQVLDDPTNITRTVLFDGNVAGNIVCWGPSDGRTIGYWIGREYWGKGIATGALTAFLEELRERPLRAHVAKHNVASLRVLEKCGFVVAGGATVPLGSGDETVEELILELDA